MSIPVRRGRVVVVGLGPYDESLLTVGTARAIEAVPVRFVRTTRHPAAGALGPCVSFDYVYEAAERIEQVYPAIVERLVAAAAEHGEVLYAVPGSPTVAEHSVELLLADDRVEAEVLPALSFVDLTWARLGVDPLAAGARIVDGHRFAIDAAGERGPLLVAQCDRRDVLSDIKLAVGEPAPEHAVVLQRLGGPDEAIVTVAWADLDREVEPDHLTSVWIPTLAAPVAAELARFAELVAHLRRECPWDRRQTHASLARYLLEESYETLDALDHVDPGSGAGMDHLCEELGDLLFQVVFHATIAAEDGWFDLADVARGIHDKLRHRHPHVFGDVDAADHEVVEANWDRIKAAEKGRSSALDGVPQALPALALTSKLQKRATNAGYGITGIELGFADVADELAELRQAIREAAIGAAGIGDTATGHTVPASGGAGAGGDDRAEVDPAVAGELGDVLFAVVRLARALDVDAEDALRAATGRFADRVRVVEGFAAERGLDLASLGEDDKASLWAEAKRSLT
ncbi:MAG: MazG family protein [Actinomycetota bacterium]|nr:MazG family protein [Actinomycetota bacterium]